MRVAVLTISDAASRGEREDRSGAAIVEWIGEHQAALAARALVPDEADQISMQLLTWSDGGAVDVILTTGGTGLAPRDVTPEATLAVADKELPGFGEEMRRISRHFVPTAILSRQTAVIRGKALIINLPGQPKSIRETLEGVRSAEGALLVDGIFSAVPYCIDLIGGPYIETKEPVCKAFRPKSALRLT